MSIEDDIALAKDFIANCTLETLARRIEPHAPKEARKLRQFSWGTTQAETNTRAALDYRTLRQFEKNTSACKRFIQEKFKLSDNAVSSITDDGDFTKDAKDRQTAMINAGTFNEYAKALHDEFLRKISP